MPDTPFDAIYGHLTSSWAETDLVFENEDYQLPDVPASFIYAEVVGDAYGQDTFGAPQANEWVEDGVIYLHIMVPNGTGTSSARQIGGRLMYLFREQPIGALLFSEMSIGAGEPGRTFGNYFAMTVTIAFSNRDVTAIPSP